MKFKEPDWLSALKVERSIPKNNQYRIRIHEVGHALAAIYYNLGLEYIEIGDKVVIEDPRYDSLGRAKTKAFMNFVISPDVWLVEFPYLVYCSSGVAATEVVLGIKEKLSRTDNSGIEDYVRCLNAKERYSTVKCPPYPMSNKTISLLRQAAFKEARSLMIVLEEEIVKIAGSLFERLECDGVLNLCGIDNWLELVDLVKERLTKNES